MPAFCEEEDVKEVLQQNNLGGSIGSAFVEPAINAASGWFGRQTNGHWYDTGGGTSLVDTASATASNVVLDVPSSPHRQDRYLISDDPMARYPVTLAGPFAEIPLPHIYVDTITALDVRELGGDVTDWVAESSITEGKDGDYYVEQRGQNSYGRSYLYVKATTIGARTNFGRLLTVDYSYGLDAQTTEWQDVRRGVACLAGAELISEDSVITQIPESGTLVGVETQHQQLVNQADQYLSEYISAMGDNR